jgi:hypothetical protein
MEFSIDKILSVSTGRLVARNHMDGVYEILGYMTNDPGISTIGLMVVAKDCEQEILRQHPQLKDVTDFELDDDMTREERVQAIEYWLREQEIVFGRKLDIQPLPRTYQREGDFEAVARIKGWSA